MWGACSRAPGVFTVWHVHLRGVFTVCMDGVVTHVRYVQLHMWRVHHVACSSAWCVHQVRGMLAMWRVEGVRGVFICAACSSAQRVHRCVGGLLYVGMCGRVRGMSAVRRVDGVCGTLICVGSSPCAWQVHWVHGGVVVCGVCAAMCVVCSSCGMFICVGCSLRPWPVDRVCGGVVMYIMYVYGVCGHVHGVFAVWRVHRRGVFTGCMAGSLAA